MPIDRTLTRRASIIYAETLLGATSGDDSAFEVSGQLEQVLATVRGSGELRGVLADRTIPAERRSELVREVFAGFNAALLEVLVVMVERGDISLLPRVNEAYIAAAEEALGSVIIDVTTVIALDDGLRDSIKKKYSAQFGKEVLLREHVDPSLVGGIVLSTHGRRIDASVVSQLERARTVLATVSSGGDR
ncbi:MAG: ATP synthase F1 subunit delta [Coriobacteriales bacterium]|jgi:F-type H+-transporting ATPase subunit delta|nr:ATP synthase F1 subunit delta [Coriobacteriales bacterium]